MTAALGQRPSGLQRPGAGREGGPVRQFAVDRQLLQGRRPGRHRQVGPHTENDLDGPYGAFTIDCDPADMHALACNEERDGPRGWTEPCGIPHRVDAECLATPGAVSIRLLVLHRLGHADPGLRPDVLRLELPLGPTR